MPHGDQDWEEEIVQSTPTLVNVNTTSDVKKMTAVFGSVDSFNAETDDWVIMQNVLNIISTQTT